MLANKNALQCSPIRTLTSAGQYGAVMKPANKETSSPGPIIRLLRAADRSIGKDAETVNVLAMQPIRDAPGDPADR